MYFRSTLSNINCQAMAAAVWDQISSWEFWQESKRCSEFLIERNPHAIETLDIDCKVHILKWKLSSMTKSNQCTWLHAIITICS